MSSITVEAPRVAKSVTPAPESENLRVANWLFRSNYASVIWLVVRLWLGYQWLNAGYQKIWGSEKMGFWYGGGAGVFGFAKAGVAANSTPYGAVGYGWWAAFLHNFVMPNASWIAKLISISEFAIGIGLILGLFTGVAAFAAVMLNFTYMMTGSAGVNPFYALLAIPSRARLEERRPARPRQLCHPSGEQPVPHRCTGEHDHSPAHPPCRRNGLTKNRRVVRAQVAAEATESE